MAKAKNSEKAVKPNIFMRLGFFVLLLMALVTGMDFGLGKLTLWIFG